MTRLQAHNFLRGQINNSALSSGMLQAIQVVTGNPKKLSLNWDAVQEISPGWSSILTKSHWEAVEREETRRFLYERKYAKFAMSSEETSANMAFGELFYACDIVRRHPHFHNDNFNACPYDVVFVVDNGPFYVFYSFTEKGHPLHNASILVAPTARFSQRSIERLLFVSQKEH